MPFPRPTILRSLRLLLAGLLASLLLPSLAHADLLEVGGFQLASPALFVHERDGAAVVTVTRSDARFPAQVRYGAWHMSADPYRDYTPVGGRLDFAAGQSSSSFQVPIVDHGMAMLPRTLKVGLYGASPIGLGQPSTAVLTIVNDDAVDLTRNPVNPLGVAAGNGNPLLGAHFFVDKQWGLAARQARLWRGTHPAWAAMMDIMAAQPDTKRFGGWDGARPGLVVQRLLERAAAQAPGTVPLISTYALRHVQCGNYADSAANQAAFKRWYDSFAQGIGSYRAVIFMEEDAIITAGCLSGRGLRVRMHELHYAISKLAGLPHTVIYLDAGAADAISATRAAHVLRLAGVSKIQGFFLNSTHYDWTSKEIRFGEAISRMTGGKHFVVNTAVNGQGPLTPRHPAKQGNEVLCDPPGRGLGPVPSANTGYPNVDGFFWIGNPGRSSHCYPGTPPNGAWWPQYALELVKHADFRVR